MKTSKRFLVLAAIILIALAFTFSGCSSDNDDNKGSGNSGDPDAIVDIGEQIWKKYNLNVPHNSGNGNSWCYDEKESNCNIYGRL
jgi:hypothetical protein